MSIKIQFISTRKKRIRVQKIPAYWQEFIDIDAVEKKTS